MTTMKIRNIVYPSVFIPFLAWAQPADFGTWFCVAAKKKINKQFSLSLTEQFRFDENSTRLNVLYSDLGLSCKLNNYIKVTTAYRNIYKSVEYQVFSYRHRIYGDFDFRYSISKLELKFRTRVEREIKQTILSEKDLLPENLNRNKLTASYRINKIEPFVSYELFIPFSNLGAELEKERYSVGAGYKISKNISCNVFYLLQRSLMPKFNRWHVLGADLVFEF